MEIELTEDQAIEDVVEFCNTIAEVEYAEIDFPVRSHAFPNDPDFPVQWHLHNIGQEYPESGSYNHPPGLFDADIDASESWDIITDSSDIIIAVIDTGVDYEHSDIAGNMWINASELNGNPNIDDDNNGYVDDIYGYNIINQTNDPRDDNGHGTHCAGIIAAQGNNGADISGVCWSARIMALKILDSNGEGSSLDSIEAIVYAVQNGARIISNSYGGSGQSQAVQEAIRYAIDSGVVFLASAGNEGIDSIAYPAGYDDVISVAATDSLDHIASFSNYGDWVDLAAPGVDILSLRAAGTSIGTIYDETTIIASGTSMACPVAAGVCGLLLGMNPTLAGAQVESLLYSNLDTIDGHLLANNGRINAYAAIAALYGQVRFGHRFYSCTSDVDVWISDIDLAGAGIASALIVTDSGDSENLTLYETGNVLGFFTGSITTDGGPAAEYDGILQISHDESIQVSYFDAGNISGQAGTLKDTVKADCLGPVISAVDVSAPGSVVTVRVITDEPAKIRLMYSDVCNDLSASVIQTDTYLMENVIKIRNLSPDSIYYFVMESEDILGNRSYHDNNGNCYSFTSSTVLGELRVPDEFATIQSAVDRAWDDDTILLSDGVYTGSGNYNIVLDGKQLFIKSLNGASECIIDCNSMGRGFIINNTSSTIIEGITIKRGYAKKNVNHHIAEYMEGGAGIYAFQSNVVIMNCIFENNFAGGYGGAVYGDSVTVEIFGSQFTGNRAVSGGACSFDGLIDDSNVRMENCIVHQNRTTIYGGGLDFWHSSVTILNSQIRSNKAQNDSFYTTGGGINIGTGSKVLLGNSVIQYNSAEYGGGISVLGAESEETSLSVTNCKIIQNHGFYGGGGFVFECDTYYVNDVFEQNTSSQGGALFQSNDVCSVFQNCTISGNVSEDTGGGIKNLYEPNSILINSILWGNLPSEEQIYNENKFEYPYKMNISFCTMERGTEGVFDPDSSITWGQGNLSENPLFAFPGDSHLLAGSPCIDQGTPDVPYRVQTDSDGGFREIDGNSDGLTKIDIGAYEYDPIHPRIAVSESYFQLNGAGNDPFGLTEVFQICNAGGGNLSWKIDSSVDWIQADPSQGISPEGSISDVTLRIDTSLLSGGEYQAAVFITDSEAVNSPRMIVINLHLAGIIYVPSQYPTIQAGIDAAQDGDRVVVADGVYQGQGNRDLQFNGKAIVLRSENGPERCIIDAQGSARDPHRAFGLYLTEETNETVIDGFTLMGGYVNFDFFNLFPPFDGGAVWCGSSSPLIRNCIIKDNTAENAGGAMYFLELTENPDSRSIIGNCHIYNNHALFGGGALNIADFVDVYDSLIVNNQSGVEGGGIWMVGAGTQNIVNCTIADNTAQNRGGGIFIWNSYQALNLPTPQFVEISNSIIYGNAAGIGNEISTERADPYSSAFWGSPSQWKSPKIRIRSSNVPDGDDNIDLYPDSQLVWDGSNFHEDPLFRNSNQGDYRLSEFSGCIDRGLNESILFATETDLDNHDRILDGNYDGLPQVDLGAYEFVPTRFNGPLIEISKWEFDFIAYQGGQNPIAQTFRLRNSGTGVFEWEIPASCSWLTISPQQGTAGDDELTEITLQPDITGLQRGLYTCELSIEAPDGANHPRTFTVNLRILERGKLFVPSDIPSIQTAINFAAEKDWIIVEPGTYQEDLYFSGKEIIVSSRDPNDWDTVCGTILSGSGENPVVTFSGAEKLAELAGFTITGGSTLDSGGGILGNNTRAAVRNCVIRGNSALDSGGGIYGVMGRIVNCRIEENSAEVGGGIADCNDVMNCVISSNQSLEGGGLYNTNGNIIHCTIAYNTAEKGAGASLCAGLIQNSIIWGNQYDSLYRCSQPTFSCVQGRPQGSGNIDMDPEFIDPKSNNYRLLPGSFCIDTAESINDNLLLKDIEHIERPLDGNNDGFTAPDMGAYEMTVSDLRAIGISQSEFVFTNLDPSPQTLRIWNAGLPAIQYTVQEPNCTWLSVFPASGTVSGVPETLTLTVNPAGMSAGAYVCPVEISDPLAINSPRIIDVQLKILQEEIHITPEGSTIQHALEYVTEGGRVILADGVYTGPGNRDIDFMGRAAIVRSENGPDDCVIDLGADPNTPHRAFLFQNDEGPESVIDGLTIINGRHSQAGAAVFCDNSSPTIINCRFQNNISQADWGGAVYSQYGSPVICQSQFAGNNAQRGGAVGILKGNMRLIDNGFDDNTALSGGAVYNRQGELSIQACSFTHNEADDGGALYCDRGLGKLTDSLFVENAATYENWNHGGGAVYNVSSDLVIQGCQFTANQGGWDGGAIINRQSSPHIENCEFTENQALGNDGGAIFNIYQSDPNVARCVFISNSAKSWGGAMRNQQSSPIIENCLFVANDAVDNGGAVFNYAASSPIITNCTLTQNTANGHEGGAMYSLTDCDPVVTNTIFWANELPQVFDSDASTAIAYSNIGWPGVGNIDMDPVFHDPNNYDFRLGRTSPCIDAGRQVPLVLDLEGNPRPWDCPWISDSAGSAFDMGAFEFFPVQGLLRITPRIINCKSGYRWMTAYLILEKGVWGGLNKSQNVLLMTEDFSFRVEKIRVFKCKKHWVLRILIDKNEFCQNIETSGKIEVSITGILNDGSVFSGTDEIRVICEKKPGNNHHYRFPIKGDKKRLDISRGHGR